MRKMKKTPGSPSRRRVETVRTLLCELRRTAEEGEPLADHLRRLVEETGDPGAELAWLAAYDPDEPVRSDAGMLLVVAGDDPNVPRDARESIEVSAAPVILSALRDSRVGDERKLLLGSLLSHLGFDLPEDYEELFGDYDSARETTARLAARGLSADPESVGEVLQKFGLLERGRVAEPSERDVRNCFGCMLKLSEHNPEDAAPVLIAAAAIAHEHGLVPDDCARALDIAADSHSGRAAWFLRALGEMPGALALGEKARALAADLRKTGVKQRPPLAGEFSHGIVTNVDGAGSRSVMLFYRTSEGGMDCLSLLLNDTVGVKDVWCMFREAAELESDVREREGGKIRCAPCSVDLAREFVADAAALHEGLDEPFPGRFLLYRHLLGEEPIAPRRRTPNLGAYMLETLVRGPEMVEGSGAVAEDPVYDDLWFASDEAYAFVKRRMRSKRAAFPLTEKAFAEFASGVASKERDILVRRLAMNLEIEALAGRATRKTNRLAARAYLALVEDIVPFERIPLVVELCRKSVKGIAHNLRGGYRSQEEANRASLRIDEALSEIESDLAEEEW